MGDRILPIPPPSSRQNGRCLLQKITYKQPVIFYSAPRVIQLANLISPRANYAFLLPCHYCCFNSVYVCQRMY
ncbi:hypothetical protein K503DRAFT_567255 [Rhizopogon vinicolor AM-OR11-026]|uniref:Uncharacterized protein n=1 Tax=Rhizopogon vinicolor AM-OR11-026 TaxID=1314800 RepID=A0A1B7MK10_9AGAM|nr:hypothetical protein K503DRAFT_567255 [Rhizopogon vinicolor AM-OR11-026]